MFPRFEAHHDFIVCQHSRDGEYAARKGFPQNQQIWAGVFVVGCKQAPGAGNASLDFICDEQHIVLGTKLSNPRQITFVGNHHTSLTLDGFDHEGTNVGVFQLAFQCFQVVVGDEIVSRHVRPKILVAQWIIRT